MPTTRSRKAQPIEVQPVTASSHQDTPEEVQAAVTTSEDPLEAKPLDLVVARPELPAAFTSTAFRVDAFQEEATKLFADLWRAAHRDYTEEAEVARLASFSGLYASDIDVTELKYEGEADRRQHALEAAQRKLTEALEKETALAPPLLLGQKRPRATYGSKPKRATRSKHATNAPAGPATASYFASALASAACAASASILCMPGGSQRAPAFRWLSSPKVAELMRIEVIVAEVHVQYAAESAEAGQVLQSVRETSDATQPINNANSKYRPDLVVPELSTPGELISPDDIIVCIEIYRPDQAPSRGKPEQACACPHSTILCQHLLCVVESVIKHRSTCTPMFGSHAFYTATHSCSGTSCCYCLHIRPFAGCTCATYVA
ncbi:hypothetical protein MMC07_000433 [Pseudocyphellaria aurata]|nr:hypothetical protein [Pseudocyphellaria aurata]